METASANSRIHDRPQQAQRRSGSQGQRAAQRTAATAADGFLSSSFAPKYTPAAKLPKRKETEGDFFKSFSRLKKHYGIELASYRRLPYPYNVLLTKQELDRKLRLKDRRRELLIVRQDNQEVCLSVRENFRRMYSLYYVPVIPVYHLWQTPEHRPTAELLTAVCAYLYVEAGLSYYRDEATYMYYNYEILQEWMLDATDEDGESRDQEIACLNEAEQAGDFIQSKMRNKAFRESLAEFIGNFCPATPYQSQALAIAKKTLTLWQAHPGGNLFEHCSLIPEDEDEYDCSNTVYMHEYISFIGSSTDAVSDTLFEMVENDFNERGQSQEPEMLTHFHEALPAYADKLGYAAQVFDLITDLCTLLYEKP